VNKQLAQCSYLVIELGLGLEIGVSRSTVHVFGVCIVFVL